jgi:hypothetical protein
MVSAVVVIQFVVPPLRLTCFSGPILAFSILSLLAYLLLPAARRWPGIFSILGLAVVGTALAFVLVAIYAGIVTIVTLPTARLGFKAKFAFTIGTSLTTLVPAATYGAWIRWASL